MTDQQLLELTGGRPVMTGGEATWDFGCRPSSPEDTAAVTVPHDPAEDVPEIQGDRVDLWEYARAANGGKLPSYGWQITGSCVGFGFLNMLITRIGVECVCLPDAEAFRLPFVLAAYGYSRHLNGDDSPGEGSSGDAMARAAAELGVLPIDDPAVPRPTYHGPALRYTRDIELKYSAFRNVPQDIRDRSKGHTAQFVALKTLDECEKELRRGRPFTIAGNWGGRVQCGYRGTGANRVLWNGERADTWNHQQSVLSTRRHPELGRIWYVMNNWFMLQGDTAVSLHGTPAGNEPPGGYWVGDSVIQYQLNYRFGELRAFKGFKGFGGALNFGNI